MKQLKVEVFTQLYHAKVLACVDVADFINKNNIKREDIFAIIPSGNGFYLYYYA